MIVENYIQFKIPTPVVRFGITYTLLESSDCWRAVNTFPVRVLLGEFTLHLPPYLQSSVLWIRYRVHLIVST